MPEERGCIHGELHLRWSGDKVEPPVLVDTKLPKGPPAEERKVKPEKRLADLYAKMTPDQRKIFHEKLKEGQKGVSKEPHRIIVQPTRAAKVDPQMKALVLYAHVPPAVRSRSDPQREEKDRRRFEALKKAFGGQIPGMEKLPK